jgi:hypothetical protein
LLQNKVNSTTISLFPKQLRRFLDVAHESVIIVAFLRLFANFAIRKITSATIVLWFGTRRLDEYINHKQCAGGAQAQ